MFHEIAAADSKGQGSTFDVKCVHLKSRRV